MLKKVLTLLFSVLLTCSVFGSVYAENGNLVQNPSFEDDASWVQESFNKDAAEFKFEEGDAHTGKRFATITNNSENDSRFLQEIRVKSDTIYKLSCWIRTENIGQEGKGANLSIGSHFESSKEVRGTNGKWEYVEMYAKVGKGIETFNVTIGVGGYGSLSKGKASFDDVVIEEVESIPGGASTAVIEKPDDNGGASTSQGGEGNAGGFSGTFLVVVLGVAAIIGLNFYLVIKRSPKAEEKTVKGGAAKETAGYTEEEIEDFEEPNTKDKKGK